MKRARKIGALTTVALLAALLLQGCSSGTSGGASSKPSGGSSGATVTLKVWGDLPNQAVLEKPYKAINEAFTKKYPSIKIQYDFAQNDQSLNVALQANELPDLFFVQGDKTPKMKEMVKNGFLLPLNDYKIDTSRFPADAVAYATVDGKLYSAPPAFLDTNLVYYNKAIFEKEGLSVPKTWDDFVKLADALVKKGITPFAMPGKSEWDRAWMIFALAPAHANDALDNIMKGKAKFNDPQIAKVLQLYRDFAEKGYYGKDFVATDLAGAQFAFTNGKAAMIVDGTWNNPTYASSGMKLGRFAIPNEKGKRVVQSSYSNFMTYAVSAKTKYPKEAAEYIRFLSSLEAQQIMSDQNGLVPAIKDIKPKDESVKEMSDFDQTGYNIYSVLSAFANDQSKPNEVLMKDVIPKLMTSSATGAEGAEMLNKAAVYK